MTIKEMKKAKQELSTEIEVLLKAFSDKAVVEVKNIDLDTFHCINGRPIYTVKVKVEL